MSKDLVIICLLSHKIYRKCVKETKFTRRHTEFVYVGDDGSALLQVGGSEAVHRQHDEGGADEAATRTHRQEVKES